MFYKFQQPDFFHLASARVNTHLLDHLICEEKIDARKKRQWKNVAKRYYNQKHITDRVVFALYYAYHKQKFSLKDYKDIKELNTGVTDITSIEHHSIKACFCDPLSRNSH